MERAFTKIIPLCLALTFHVSLHTMAQKLDLKTLFSKANKSESIFNNHWDPISKETKIRIKKILIRQNDTIGKKLDEFNSSNRFFDFSQIKTGFWYLIPTTAYTGACVYGLYSIYKSFTRDNGSIEDLLISISKASALWGGFTYTLPYFKKGFKKAKKGLAPQYHLTKKLENINKCRAQIKESKASFKRVKEADTKRIQDLSKEKTYIVG